MHASARLSSNPCASSAGRRERNLIVEARATEGRAERFAEHAAELVALQVDVAVGSNSQAVQALKDKTWTIPIVMLDAASPVEQGFIVSLARPGGNITGVTNQLTISTNSCSRALTSS